MKKNIFPIILSLASLSLANAADVSHRVVKFTLCGQNYESRFKIEPGQCKIAGQDDLPDYVKLQEEADKIGASLNDYIGYFGESSSSILFNRIGIAPQPYNGPVRGPINNMGYGTSITESLEARIRGLEKYSVSLTPSGNMLIHTNSPSSVWKIQTALGWCHLSVSEDMNNPHNVFISKAQVKQFLIGFLWFDEQFVSDYDMCEATRRQGSK